MPVYVIRLLVALVTFGVGLGASALWGLLAPAKRFVSETPAHRVVVVKHEEISKPRVVATVKTTTETVVSGGVLNGKAISKLTPAYPEIAKAARASGTVVVKIVVDKKGDVASATAVSGHPLLQQAAVNAVRQWKFPPTLLSGEPVNVSGHVTVNFVLQ